MSKFISTALFASLIGKAVSEDVYTNLWYPGIQDSGITFVGSVVTAASDSTVMVVDYTNLASDMSDMAAGPQTVTMQGGTYVEFQTQLTESDITATVSAACSRSNTETDAEATCTISTGGLDDTLSSLSSFCAGPNSDADYCSEAGDIETVQTETLPSDYFGTFLLIVTAGGDQLPTPASAAATPTASGASATGSTLSRATSTASTSASESESASASASNSKSSAVTSSAAAEQSTAGAPMMTMAPAVAALGAAAAFFL